ncbi:MAG: enoyl-CoA hydratase [Acidimicrobiales bacterium]|nr:enoyl-CoA hydratase [Acidimicrobiales bacterium]
MSVIDAAVEGLRVEVSDRVAILTIDREHRKNSLTLAMRQAIEQICATVDDDPDVDVLVLSAVGSVFCAGVDIKEVGELGGSLTPTDPGAALRSVAKPVLCAVGGACVSGGLELALSCDLIIASEQARFADTHARLGALPRWGLSALLPRAVGLAKAKEMTITGNFVDAAEALRLGLVTRVVPDGELDAAVRALAADIVSNDQRAVRGSLDLYDRGAWCSVAEALDIEREVAFAWTVDTDDFASRRSQVTGRGSAQVGEDSQ